MKRIFVLTILIVSAEADLIIKNIQKFGYPLKMHSIVTADGYFLKLHQIPSSAGQSKGSVLLVHGILGCGSFFTYHRQSLPFVLADAGYDVWIYNGRGTSMSTRHMTMNQNMKDYWDFSLHEIGVYDLSATVDYVLSHNQNKPLSMVGYSQGATTSLIFLSSLPEYNQKIERLYLLAPVVYMTKEMQALIDIVANLNMHKFDVTGVVNTMPIQAFCGYTSVCSRIFNFIVGKTEHFKLQEQFPKILQYVDNFSAKTVKHYSQINHSNRFQQFDYGSEENKRIYGSSRPPMYDLRKVTVPTTIFYGTHDRYMDSKIMRRLKVELPNIKEMIELPYNHFDFIIAKDLYKFLGSRIVKSLDSLFRNRFSSNYVY